MLRIGDHQFKEADPADDTPASNTLPYSPWRHGDTFLVPARHAEPTDPRFHCERYESLDVVFLPQSYSNTPRENADGRQCLRTGDSTSILMLTAPFSFEGSFSLWVATFQAGSVLVQCILRVLALGFRRSGNMEWFVQTPENSSKSTL
jgi:hypothetical protein